MNPYLSAALILILRWLMLLARQQFLGDVRLSVLHLLTDESTEFCERLTKYTLDLNDMNDIEVDPNKKVM